MAKQAKNFNHKDFANYKSYALMVKIGIVNAVADGIVIISGIPSAAYVKLLKFIQLKKL